MATRIIDDSEFGKRPRRSWSDEEKARLVTAMLEPRATVRSVACRHGVDPTYADAILDRLVHNAHRLDLVGDSMRRVKTNPTA